MSVSLYDLLDVEESASADEIRSAWKSAIVDLDPTDRRFRAYNDAAAVLLDEDKRSAYDAELAAGRADEEPATEVGLNEDEDEAEDAVPAETPGTTTDQADAAPAGPPAWALWVTGGVAVVALGLMIAVLVLPGSVGGASPKERAEQAEAAERAGAIAEDAAVAAVPVVLSYDYRTLEENFAEAETHLTDEFAAQRAELFEQEGEAGLTLREQIVKDKVVVTAGVSRSALTRVSADGEQATVVVYVDQDSQRGKAPPRLLRMWASLSMVADGDRWLIDDICTEGDCS